MTYDHHRDYPEDVLARAEKVRVACFDVDGTLTDGRLLIDDSGHETKAFHVLDGLGLSLLRRNGIEIAFVTARRSPVAELRARELGAQAHTSVKDKLACVRSIASESGVDLDSVCFMGDDLADLGAMAACGFAVAPANAHPWVREHAHWRTRLRGGQGAARELCDLLLAAQGKVDAILASALKTGMHA